MDENLSRVARAGNVTNLYRLIQKDGNVLSRIDEVEFADTPLHVAADEGCIDFAMEIMSLKPSFATKLNQQGLSPIHLAVKKRNKGMALRLLEINKDLARVRGKKGRTPLHYISKEENPDDDGLLEGFLEACPECIREVTTKNQTSLHVAAKNKRLDVLQVLIRMLRRTDDCEEMVNRKDKYGNTALHIAARKNQPKVLKLLLKSKADKHATNQAGSTALDVAQEHNNRENISILRGCFIPRVSNFKYKLKKQILKYVTKASSVIFQDMDNLSGKERNALLVILGLLLTTTYQTSLSPPGSVWQGGEGSSKSKPDDEMVQVKSVMDQTNFLLFYIPTYVIFVVALFLTLALLKPLHRGFRTAFEVLLAFLAICFDESIVFIAPTNLAAQVINMFSVLVFVLMVFMCIAYRVSKVSVSILGCWLFHSGSFALLGGLALGNIIVRNVVLGCLLFLFLYDEFWKGTILVVGYYLFISTSALALIDHIFVVGPIIVIGCWLFLSLCRFCINRCCER